MSDFLETLSNVTCSSSKIQEVPTKTEPISELNETEKLLSPKSDMSINVQTNMTKREPLRTSSSSEHTHRSQRIKSDTPRATARPSFEDDEEEMIVSQLVVTFFSLLIKTFGIVKTMKDTRNENDYERRK